MAANPDTANERSCANGLAPLARFFDGEPVGVGERKLAERVNPVDDAGTERMNQAYIDKLPALTEGARHNLLNETGYKAVTL